MHQLLSVAGIDFLIQFIGFILAYSLQTEKFYDLTGSLTFLLLIQLSRRWNIISSNRQLLVSTMTSVWAIRLGSFLFYRVLLSGGDHRFDKAKTKPVTFLIFWTLQGLWVYVTLLPALLLNNKRDTKPLSQQDAVGFALWIVGFLFEVIADYQKYVFKNDPDNAGKFINSGLWSISRHPNYFGEIVMWFGIFVIAATVFSGWEWLSVFSPIFVYYLITHLSGIPILERSGLKRFGEMDSYKHYVNTVPVFFPYFGST